MDATVVSPHTLGLVLATFIGGWHIVWSLLVLLGWAQRLLPCVGRESSIVRTRCQPWMSPFY